MKKEISTHQLTNKAGIDHINVLLAGPVGVGKSSFFNNIESIFAGHVTKRANSGTIGKSMTSQVSVCAVENKLNA